MEVGTGEDADATAGGRGKMRTCRRTIENGAEIGSAKDRGQTGHHRYHAGCWGGRGAQGKGGERSQEERGKEKQWVRGSGGT